MKLCFRPLLVCITIIAGLFLFSCFDSSTEPETPTVDVGTANSLAREGMNLLNQTIIDLGNSDPEINDSQDLMQQATFNNIKSKFDASLAIDPNNPMANLGMAMLNMVEINYDDELWNMMEDAGVFDNGEKRILNNQFQFLAKMPVNLMNQIKNSKENTMSIMRVQNFIRNNILPKMDTSISRLDKAVLMADSTVLHIEVDDEEIVEIDCGEIYAFRAVSHAVKAAFNLMVAYDMNMTDPDGGYDWLDELNNIDVPDYPDSWNAYAYNISADHLYLDYYENDYQDDKHQALQMEIQAKIAKYNMDNSSTFMKLTPSGVAYLSSAKAAILSAAADIKNGVNYILAESDTGDGQNDDLIKIENIISINDEIPPDDEDAPQFAQNWNTINDIADWLTNEVLAGSYTLTANNIEFQVNLSAFFNGAIPDMEAVLPYFHWRDTGSDWVYDYVDYEYSFDTPNGYYNFLYNGQYTNMTNIYHVHKREHDIRFDPGYLTTPAGVEIDEDDYPYFPDYTFGGIFPGMTRQKMIDIFG